MTLFIHDPYRLSRVSISNGTKVTLFTKMTGRAFLAVVSSLDLSDSARGAYKRHGKGKHTLGLVSHLTNIFVAKRFQSVSVL